MRSNDLSEPVKARLKKYDPPHSAHYGVVPAAPSRGHIAVGGNEIGSRVIEAEKSLTRLTERFKHSENAFALTRILERQEAVSSSIIEGTYSTLDALLEIEEDGEGDSEARETRGATLALNLGLERVRLHGANAFNVSMICDIHKCLADEIPDYKGKTGRLRDKIVWIGGTGDLSTSTWNPPAPKDVRPCLEDTLSYMRSEPEHISQFASVVPAAIAHAHFEAVHPFADGNGRIGRLLIPLSLAARGLTPLYLSPWIEAHKTEYYAALKSAQQKLDYSGIIDVLARSIIGTEIEFNVTMEAIGDLEAEWSNIKLRKNSTVMRAIPLLKSYPVLRVGTLSDLLGVSFKSASDGLAKLVDIGILEEKTGYTRNRIFTSPRMLKILMRQFGSDPNAVPEHDSAPY